MEEYEIVSKTYENEHRGSEQVASSFPTRWRGTHRIEQLGRLKLEESWFDARLHGLIFWL